jgi:diadenosine tetraphosphate (Ap4A) HIT family hydrolase
MKYITIVKKLEKTHTCPFCHEKKEHMLQEGKYFFVIPARAPYVKHHLLIIPKRHVNMLTTLTHAELLEMHRLVDIRAKKLHKKYKDVNLLLRDGLTKDSIINKSVNHLHFHLLPNVGIHIQSKKNADKRTRIEDKEYIRVTQAYKKTFLNK